MEVPCMWFCLRDVVLIVLLLLTGDIIKTNGPDHMVKATFLRLFIGVGMWINFEFASERKFCWLVAAREKTRECVFFAGHTLNGHFYFPLFDLRLICKFSDVEPSPAPMSYPSPKVFCLMVRPSVGHIFRCTLFWCLWTVTERQQNTGCVICSESYDQQLSDFNFPKVYFPNFFPFVFSKLYFPKLYFSNLHLETVFFTNCIV